jgi:uncharacterized protein YqeY
MLMTFEEKISNDVRTSNKAKDARRVSCLRMLKTALKHKQIEKGPVLNNQGKDLGKAMKTAMVRLSWKGPGHQVNEVDRKLLS